MEMRFQGVQRGCDPFSMMRKLLEYLRNPGRKLIDINEQDERSLRFVQFSGGGCM